MHFWSLHFGSIPILVPKLISLQISSLKKKIVFKMVSVVNPLTETSYVTDGMPCLLTQHRRGVTPHNFDTYLIIICKLQRRPTIKWIKLV